MAPSPSPGLAALVASMMLATSLFFAHPAAALTKLPPTDAAAPAKFIAAFEAKLSGASIVPSPIKTRATGSVQVSVVNSSYAWGQMDVTDISDFFMAHIHR